mgnify:CR=1 FL=1
MWSARERDLLILYAQLPRLTCQQKCQHACTSIVMSQTEWERLTRAAGSEELYVQESGRCPLLVNGRCRVYPVRPMICRLWGLTKDMACPYGCEPERWLEAEEARQFLRAAEQLSGGRMNGIFPRSTAHLARRRLAQDALEQVRG